MCDNRLYAAIVPVEFFGTQKMLAVIPSVIYTIRRSDFGASTGGRRSVALRSIEATRARSVCALARSISLIATPLSHPGMPHRRREIHPLLRRSLKDNSGGTPEIGLNDDAKPFKAAIIPP